MKSKKWLSKIDRDWTLFLDRDGTINHRETEPLTSWEQFRFIKNIPETIAELNRYFGRIIIVSNQVNIGKELMSHEQINIIHTKMLEVFDYYDAYIDEIYYDSSLPAFDSYYRKPNPGMALKAQEEFKDIDFKKSVMIGDRYSDMMFGKNLKMKTVWIENSWESGDRFSILETCDLQILHLKDFLHLIGN